MLAASDIGLPLGPVGQAALVPANVAEFAAGLGVEESDVLLYLALREAAHQRLFAHVPWLREHLIGAVADYARGIEIDISGDGGAAARHRPANPAALQEALQGGLFEPQDTPAQQAALSRLEVTLALVEGWVDEVVGQATAERMPTAGQAGRGGTPPPRRGRAGRGDLRLAGRAGAAAAPAARRLDAVGVAADPAGHRGPRRRLDAPRPAADRRRPRRPARLPRGRRARRRSSSAEEFDAGLADLLEGRLGEAPDNPATDLE